MDLPPHPFKAPSLLLLGGHGCLLGLTRASGGWPLFKSIDYLDVLIVSVLALGDMHNVFMVRTSGAVPMVSLQFAFWLGRAPTLSKWFGLRLGRVPTVPLWS